MIHWLSLMFFVSLSVTNGSIANAAANKIQDTTRRDSLLRQPVGCQELLMKSVQNDFRFEDDSCKYYYQNLIPGYFGDDDALPFSLPNFDSLVNININKKNIQRNPYDPFVYMGPYENFTFSPTEYNYRIELEESGSFSLYYATTPTDIRDYGEIPYFEGQGQLLVINRKTKVCYRIQGYYYYIGDSNNSIYRFFTVENDTINVYEGGWMNRNSLNETYYDPAILIGKIFISIDSLTVRNHIN